MANKNDFITPEPHKAEVPTTRFDLTHNNHLSMKLGRAYPCLLYDAPAHSTIRIKPSFGLDFMPFRVPVQSTIRAHLKFYKIPKRVLMKDFEQWRTLGNNIVLPYIMRSEIWHATGSLADYMGLPSTVVTNESRLVASRAGAFNRYLLIPNQGAFVDDGRIYSYSYPSGSRYLTLSSETVLSSGSGRMFPVCEHLEYGTTHEHQLGVYSQSAITWGSSHKLNFYFGLPEQRIGNELVFMNLFGVENVTYASSIGDNKFTVLSANKNKSIVINGTQVIYNRLDFRFSSANVDKINNLLDQHPNLVCFVCWSDTNESVFGNSGSAVIPFGVNVDNHGLLTFAEDKPVMTNKLTTYGVASSLFWWSNVDLHVDVSNSPFISVNGADPSIPISALPFRAYEFIHNYFYRNRDIEPFIKGGVVDPWDTYITNDGNGADTTTPVDFFDVPYEYDLFTTCVKTPTFGQSPLVPLRGRDDNGDQLAEIHMTDDNGENPYVIGLSYDGQTGAITGVRTSETYSEKDAVSMLKDAMNFGISVQDFRNYSALQRFQDRMMRVDHAHGNKYKAFVKEFFGTNPNLGEDYPEYLGGVSQTINVSKLMNTGEQENLGQFCGVGQIRSQGDTVKCFTSEDCYIMGIIYLSVTPIYTQQLPRLFTKTDRMEFANPQFNNITPQPIYKHQIAPLQLSGGHYYDTFGYNVPYVEYRQMLDECHGNFRTPSMHDYLMQRLFATAPSLNAAFITQNNADVVDVFKSTEDDDKVFGIIHFDMKNCKLPFPQYMQSKIV